MKHLLLTIAILFTLGATAQTIPCHIDSAAQVWYCSISPLPIPDRPDSTLLTQVRISFNGSVPGWYAFLRVGLYYPQPGTGRMIEYKGYNVQVNMPGGPINPVQLAFTYVRDSMTVDGEPIANIEYVP